MWSTCLQCHDFHGNHIYDAPEMLKDTLPLQTVREYLDGGTSPYADIKQYYPLEEEAWRERYGK